MKHQLYLRPSGQSFDAPFINRGFLPKLFLGGFVATLVMTLFIYIGPLLGLPNVDFAGLLGSLLVGHPVTLFSAPWWIGMAWHFINGTFVFPAFYAFWVYPVLSPDHSGTSVRNGFSAQPIRRAMYWGLMLWAFCQGFAMPFAGAGFFSIRTLQPGWVIFGSLMAHIIYGAVLGAMTASRSRRIVLIRHEEERAA